ncbi:MAG TPA: ATP-binding protein [Gemmatimonadales bacterium]|nr:ATP-binding protein [Gemmatimonadales bacterium]
MVSPGSGKTAHTRRLQPTLRAIRLAPDEWMSDLAMDLWDTHGRARIEALQWKIAKECLRRGLTVLVEWGTWGRSERDRLRLEARALGAAVELHYLAAPTDVLFERLQRRAMEQPPIRREQLEQWAQTFQVPSGDEIARFDKFCALES